MANGGIIGPVVTPPNVQTQSAPGVWTLQEAQEYIRQGLWPRRYDPLYNYTTLLLSGNGANNATNNSFLDSSSNNFTVTRNGNTTQGTFSPFSQTGWGNYFDGTGDYLSVADNSVLRLGTSNFTIECWVNRAANGTAHSILAKGGASTGWLLEVTSGNVLQFTHTTTTITTSLPVYAGNWVHVAAVREGTGANQFKLYINGTLAQTATMSTDFTQTDTLYIGANRSAATTMNGYISNVRIVNGTALYTAQFTPSTTALTTTSQGALAAQVELLTCQSNRFVDNSGNGFTVTRNGDTSIQAFSPFNATTPWDPNLYGGSGYFDGTGDYLTAGSASDWTFMSNTTALWSVEMWVYPTTSGSQTVLLDTNGGGSANIGVSIYKTTSGTVVVFVTRGVSGSPVISATSTGTLTTNAWNYVLITYDQSLASGNLNIYINGGSAETFNKTANTPSSSNPTYTLNIGRAGSAVEYFTGYLSNIRISNVIRSSAFPTAPLIAITNTSLLLSFTNGGVFDATSKNALETVDGAKISTAQSQFGGSSIAFDGSGDSLFARTSPVCDFGTGDFTIEFWLYVNSTASQVNIVDLRPGSGTYPIIYFPAGGALSYSVGGAALITGSSLSTSTWYHIALVRSSGTSRLYINGSQTGSSASDTNSYTGCVYRIGSDPSNTNVLNGYIQDVRITKGYARYTANFAVPDSAFPTLGSTPPSVDPYFDYTTLLLPGSGTNNATNNSFLDSSANNFTITRNGNTTQGTFSPFSQTGWGNYFDGSGDYLEAGTASNWTFLSNTTALFSIEAWVYLSSAPATLHPICFTNAASSANVGFGLWINSSRGVGAEITRGSTGTRVLDATTTGTIQLGAWNYVAITYDQSLASGNCKIYINNAAAETFNKTANTPSSSNPSTALLIGRGNSSTYAIGYYGSLRISNVIRTITVPTAPYTSDANTKLLTCQSNRFIDNSSNNFTITKNGDTSVVAFSPFNPTASWSAATYGGSGYFDGSGDYLTVPDSGSNLDFGTGQFSIEFWWYPTSSANGQYPLIGDASGDWYVTYEAGALQFGRRATATDVSTTGFTLTANTWQHFVITRQSTGTNDTRIFVDGILRGIATSSNSYNITNTLGIGALPAGGNNIYGYLSSLRLVKGSVPSAYSTSTTTTGTQVFSPPTAPSTAVSGTTLLLNFTNAGIYDATSKNDLETVADAKISTAQSVWTAYGASMAFDETGDYLTLPASQNVALGSGDFTIECWARFAASTVGNGMGLFQLSSGYLNSQVRGPAAGADNTTGRWSIYYGTSSTVHASLAPSTNTWYHVAFVRASGTSKLYVDGTEIISVSDSTNYTDTYFTVGGWYSSSFLLNGYLQDLRITKGIARYTANFQPPSAPLALR